jgi:hypothetical protein
MATALGLALAGTVAECCSGSASSSTTTPASSPTSTSAPVSSSAPATSASATGSGNSAAISEIKTNWAAFFSGSTPASKKVDLLQNGQKYASTIQAMASLGSAAGAQVTAVVLNSATSATVSYNITLNGTPALSNQTGTAVNEAGTWKVGDVSFCQLLKLENNGKFPSVCSSS